MLAKKQPKHKAGIIIFIQCKFMPIRTESVDNAIKILDYLLLYDYSCMTNFTDEKNVFYPDILGSADQINKMRKHLGIKKEIYQHYLMCSVEILSYFINSTSEDKVILEKLMRHLIGEVVDNGFSKYDYGCDLLNINDEYNLTLKKRELVFKLVAQTLYFDFDGTSLGCLLKLLSNGILKSGKFSSKYVEMDGEYVERLFIRAMLFCEFEILKKIYFNKDGCKANKIDKSITKVNIKNKKEIKEYLNNLSKAISDEPMFFKNFADCAGLIASWVLYEESGKSGTLPFISSITSNVSDEGEYCADGEGCAEIAHRKMLKYGYTIQPRAIYNHSYRFYDYYRLIKFSFEYSSKEEQGLFITYFEDALLGRVNKFGSYADAVQKSQTSLSNKVGSSSKLKM